SKRDWSSDVCSSDLSRAPSAPANPPAAMSKSTRSWEARNIVGQLPRHFSRLVDRGLHRHGFEPLAARGQKARRLKAVQHAMVEQIGRASCREREEVR